MVRSFVSPFFVAATVAAAPTQIVDSDDSINGFGQLEGFTFPRIGGDNADQTVMGGYVNGGSALLVYASDGAGRLGGFNSSSVDAAGNNLHGFGDFGVSASNHPEGNPVVTFVSTADDVDGVFLQLPDNTLLRVAATGQYYGPASGSFYTVSEPSVAVSDDKSTVYVTFSARAGKSWRGILLAKIPVDADSGSDVELTTVADTSTAIPSTQFKFRCLNVPQATPQGDVVFFGSNCGSTGSAFVEAQFNKLAFAGTKPRDTEILTKNRGSYSGSHVSPGIWRYGQDGSIIEVVSFSTTIPGGQPNEQFVAFSDPGVALDGTAAFVGLGNNGSYGIFKGSRYKSLSLVAGRQTPMPGYSGITFQSMPNVPSLGPLGEVVFFASADSSHAGIFAEDPYTGELSTVINYDTYVDGQPALYIGYGTQAYSKGVASAYIVLNDTTCGVWNLPVTHTKSLPTELV